MVSQQLQPQPLTSEQPQTQVPPPTKAPTSNGGGLLLCCVCHEHNTTFRYEVVYKNAGTSISTLTLHPPTGLIAINNNFIEPRQQQLIPRCQSVRITELTDDGHEIEEDIVKDTSLVLSSPLCQTVSPVGTVSLFSDDQSHEYYNFPPRHPRHGHLKWPVWTPNPSPTPNGSVSTQLVATYPDYPIHIPTVTLKRISSARKGKNMVLG